MNRKKLYWSAQFSGWFIYIALAYILSNPNYASFNFSLSITLLSVAFIGILTTHLYRYILQKFNWLELKLYKLIPRILISITLLSALFEILYLFISEIFTDKTITETQPLQILQEFVSWITLYGIWSLIYFMVHYFENYKKEEIKALQFLAKKNEIELNMLKSQLNPHFLFNSMNSIRALINSDPEKAKKSITQLSGLLRNSLQIGKKNLISFQEELDLVKDYIEIESIRYEERLSIKYEIAEDSYKYMIPPMMLQTLVENAIKHGISTLPKGGEIVIKTTEESNF